MRCVFWLLRSPDDGQNPQTQRLCFIHHRQNPLDSAGMRRFHKVGKCGRRACLCVLPSSCLISEITNEIPIKFVTEASHTAYYGLSTYFAYLMSKYFPENYFSERLQNCRDVMA
jgi:hypothetical protein